MNEYLSLTNEMKAKILRGVPHDVVMARDLARLKIGLVIETLDPNVLLFDLHVYSIPGSARLVYDAEGELKSVSARVRYLDRASGIDKIYAGDVAPQ